jgi:hypothetical protein
VGTILAYVAAAVVAVWGVAHAIPTRQVLAGFEPVSADNRLIIVQEWLAEALAMWGIAAVVIITTAIAGTRADVSVWVDRVAACLLLALAVLTGLTGARTPVVWFKVCPWVLTGAAVLLLLAGSV